MKTEEKHFGYWRVSSSILLRCFFVPQDMLLVMKTLEDEWYVNIKAYKFTVFEI